MGIIFIILLVIVGILLIVFLIDLLSGSKKSSAVRFQKDRIVVKKGQDVRKNVLGDDKGKLFVGREDDYGTLLVKPGNSPIWKISFTNVKTHQIYRFKLKGKLTIGRKMVPGDTSQWLEIQDDPRVSTSHCLIYIKNNQLILRDLQSKNHTYLNGTRVERDVRLNVGDILLVGRTKLKIEFGRG